MTTSAVTPRPLDLKRVHRDLYTAPDQPCLVDVPDLVWLAADGVGAPESPAYGEAVAALFTVSYTLRGLLRAAGGPGHVVMPLEALWWTPDPAAFRTTPRAEWHWTAMILQPPGVDDDLVRTAVGAAAVKAGAAPAVGSVGLRRLGEARSAQVMHHGPFSAEAPTIDALHRFIAEQGLAPRGHHHEIYLSDPRRVSPERMRTILRQPVV